MEEILKRFGSSMNLASILKLNPSAVSHWKTRGFPAAWAAIEIERLTNGDIKAVDSFKF